MDSGDYDGYAVKVKQEINPALMEACKNGDLRKAEMAVAEGAEIRDEVQGWTALSCASANNHIDIVRLLIQNGGSLQYRRDQFGSKTHPPEVKLGTIQEEIKNTPLLWACLKGNWRVMCVLLKEGLPWDDIDSAGNTAVHLAASSNTFKTLELLLEYGVDITLKNSRSHTPLDLTTNPESIALLRKCLKADTCAKSGRKFRLGEIKYLCHTCRSFVCAESREFIWSVFWTSMESIDKHEEMPLSLCNDCHQNTTKAHSELKAVIELQDEEKLRVYLAEIVNNPNRNLTLDIRKIKDGYEELEKLKTQNEIKAFIKTLDVVENYKTILKTQETLTHMLKDADMRKVRIDQYVFEMIESVKSRLNAERDLRKFMEHMDLSKCDPSFDHSLGRLVAEAERVGVSEEYLKDARELKDRMSRTLEAGRILEDFQNYGPRPEYPVYPIMVKGKWMHPETKKAVDPKKPVVIQVATLKVDRKKWKNHPQPAWFTQISDIETRSERLKTILKSTDLNIDQDFLKNANAHIDRMAKEVRLLKQIAKDEGIIEAETKSKKK